MTVELLTSKHKDSVQKLFMARKYMGVDYNLKPFTEPEAKYMNLAYDNFCDTYLSDLNNYKAFGFIQDAEIKSYISFYESIESPEWYWTQVRSIDKTTVSLVLDQVAKYNELNGRLKFYSMFNSKYRRSYRKFAFSDEMNLRYDYFDEFIIPEKTKCLFNLPWQILFNRTLVPVESIVRCTFLKQEFRSSLPILGNL